MPRKLRIDKKREALSLEQEAWLQSDDEGACFFKYMGDDDLRALWDLHRDRIIQEHVSVAPGTRPARFWQYDAPEPRKRLGGTGTPVSNVLACVPVFAFGLPAIWISAWMVAYYSGRARDINNQPIGYHGGRDFAGVAIDPDDPPTFESQATYLDRHKLLLAGEGRRSDYSPTSISL
jgi:hypothetical protein